VIRTKKGTKLNNIKNKKNINENDNDFLDEEYLFSLWKEELNKDLLTFWKSMSD
jgi:hypothetical protein